MYFANRGKNVSIATNYLQLFAIFTFMDAHFNIHFTKLNCIFLAWNIILVLLCMMDKLRFSTKSIAIALNSFPNCVFMFCEKFGKWWHFDKKCKKRLNFFYFLSEFDLLTWTTKKLERKMANVLEKYLIWHYFCGSS